MEFNNISSIGSDSSESSETLDSRLPSKTPPPSTPSSVNSGLTQSGISPTNPRVSHSPFELPIPPTVSDAAVSPSPHSIQRARKAMGPPDVEAYKDEIIGMYSSSTNNSIRNTLAKKYNIRVTEKQLKRVLRLWKAYKNDRGVRKATIVRKHNRTPRVPRRKQRRLPKRMTPQSSEEDELVDKFEDIDRNVDFIGFDDGQEYGQQTALNVRYVHIPPSSPVLSTWSYPSPHIPASSSPSGSFSSLNETYTFNSPLMPVAISPKDFNMEPPFMAMIPTSPFGTLSDCRDRIVRLFMEAVQRFDGYYHLSECPNRNHWAVYRNMQNVHEQRLRQGVLIAESRDDSDLLEETLIENIVPLYKKLDLLAIVGLIATFASLKNNNFITALLHHLRKNICIIQHPQRKMLEQAIDCFRDLLYRHKWEAELFHKDLKSALVNLPIFIQDTLGRQSLVGTHLIFLLGLGDISNLVENSFTGEKDSNDICYILAARYLLAGKLFYTNGVNDPNTRQHVNLCYKVAKDFKKYLDRKNTPQDHEFQQDVFHYLCRVGIWKVHCDSRQRTPEGCYGAEPKPPFVLLEESILYGELCQEDGPQSPIIIQALYRLRDMYESVRDYVNAELVTLRIQAVDHRRKVRKQDSPA